MKYILSGKKYSPKEFRILMPPRKKLTSNERKRKNREKALKYYYEHKEECLKNIKDWKRRNPEMSRYYSKKTFAKWYAKKKGRVWMKNYMKEYYHKHSDHQRSRVATYRLRPLIAKKCKTCGCKEKTHLQIHHEIYPTTKDEVIKAIKGNRIYYVCNSCHNLL